MSEAKPLTAAVAGLGWWGRHIVTRLRDSGKLRIARAVDPHPAAAGFAKEHGLPLGGALDEVLADGAIDAVILATPHTQHVEQVEQAAAAGKHVFCEKPLALTLEGARRAQRACDAAGVLLGIGHERRFEPALMEIKRLVDEDSLGTPMHVEANFNHDKLSGLDASSWRASAEEAPAAGMTGMGVHLTDAFINLFGDIDTVYALSTKRVLPRETGDVVSVLLRFQSGLTGYLNAILATPHHCRLLVYGSQAWAEALNSTHPDTPGPTWLTLRRKGAEPEAMEFEWRDTVRANLEAFADAIAGRAEYPYTPRQKVHNVAVLEAIVESTRSGEPVRVG